MRVLERSPASSCKQCPVTRRIVFLWLEIVLVRRVPQEGVRERIVPVARHVERARAEVPLRVDRDPRVGVRRVAVRLVVNRRVAVRLVVNPQVGIRRVVAHPGEVQRDANRVVAGVMIEPMGDVEVVTATPVVNRVRVEAAGSRIRVTPVVNRAGVKVVGNRVRVMVVGMIVGPAVRRELAETIAAMIAGTVKVVGSRARVKAVVPPVEAGAEQMDAPIGPIVVSVARHVSSNAKNANRRPKPNGAEPRSGRVVLARFARA